MKIGLQLNHYNSPGGPAGLRKALALAACEAEDVGFDSLWVLDHFFQMEGAGPVDEPMLEAYTVLGYLAALTERIKLGVTVTGVVYRHPAVLVKTVSTLDVLSGGRAWLGIGAAWYEREARGLGIPFPATGIRFEWLEETLQIAHRMWSVDPAPFKGEHFELAEPLNRPQPLAHPHPPIMVGGMGEKKTLRLVAQYADACNFDFPIGVEALQHKLDVLRAHCADVGRDFDSIVKTAVGGIEGKSTDSIVMTCRVLAEMGFSHVILNMPDVYDITPIARLGRDVIPAVREL
jgi:F420-dependent oxidoreductase-like protein